MVQFFKKVNNQIVEVNQPETDCWINVYPPFDTQNLAQLSKQLDIPLDFFTDSIDINERSRFEEEDGVKLIVINIPVLNTANSGSDDVLFVTVPIGIILIDNMILTISARKNQLIDWFIENTIKNLQPHERSLFTLKIFEKNVDYYLRYLREINVKRNLFEKELYNSSRNQELAKLLNLQKSLVYFVTNLRANEMLMMKINRTDFLGFKGDEFLDDYLDDIIVDNSQAVEMANVYTNILNGTMDAFASIISNNLNQVMRRLTSVTIILMVPTLIASFYGMNVDLPLQNHEFAFPIIFTISLVLSLGLAFFFWKKRWF